MPSLTKLLEANERIDFVIDYISPLQEFDKKDGGTYQAHEVKLKTMSNNVMYDARFFENHPHKTGDMVRGYLNAKGYPDFTKVESGEPRNNGQEVKKERELAGRASAEDVKSICISLQGLVQAYIIAGHEDPLGMAQKMRILIIQSAEEISQS